ncbi:hypothetical protein [Rhizobium sp. RU36D]|uniref:hypothetical protein n=1 Tax=Rhizobium sp. RU36D TaxID=1907415 RepID=UPI0009D887B1|nr:hypothetical protein [Rhizobium sp. RU36D]SMD16417.1 hypothetical protein SAMN05880593_12981 [Rhizobium sp. RU36D]
MTTKDDIIDTGKFAAELKSLAQTVLEEKAKTKPPTKTEIIASDEVWNAIKEMQEIHGMTLADIAAVFQAKGGIWSQQNANNLGSLIKEARILRGEESDGKKGRKSKVATKRSQKASSEASPKTSSKPSSEPRGNPTPASGGEGAAPAASAGSASQPGSTDAKVERKPAAEVGTTEAPVNPAYINRKRL